MSRKNPQQSNLSTRIDGMHGERLQKKKRREEFAVPHKNRGARARHRTVGHSFASRKQLFINSANDAVRKKDGLLRARTRREAVKRWIVDVSTWLRLTFKCPAELWDRPGQFMWCARWQQWAPVTPLLYSAVHLLHTVSFYFNSRSLISPAFTSKKEVGGEIRF